MAISTLNDAAAKYDPIASVYDKTRRADPQVGTILAQQLELSTKARLLDVGCGTGNYAAFLMAMGAEIVGVDPSENMLEIARERCANAQFHRAGAEQLPLEDAEFQGAFSMLAVHHFADVNAACREVHRVLAPDANYVIFGADPDQILTYWLVEYFPSVFQKITSKVPRALRVLTALRDAGFRNIRVLPWDVPPTNIDDFLYGAKHSPSRYLDPNLRRGSTLFREADQEAVTQGCERLRSDIETGRIAAVMAHFPSTCGDYFFITAKA
ncbi:class I SAM-dependent methyltransferase [Sinorhizobium sp. 8-89]|uniref:class I SAM-dependent methyltransferase n=1 Tax=Sinorhizobium sp. 7-81 TaxID=3049087 RepID=UPI0024C21430|nr:class I SAM-dependent methyltransferase [Sinorhizobium sp. 7-81]MDK1389505.1 class I SAM-dependent methyltransferase [Sinorhizobium sp. 7-81]